MYDQFNNQGNTLDIEQLQRQLGAPVVPVSGYNSKQVRSLKSQIATTLNEIKSSHNRKKERQQQKPRHSLQENEISQSIQRFRWIDNVLKKVKQDAKKQKLSYNRKLDNLFTHRFGGLIIFVALMYIIFYAIYTGAEPAMEWIENGLQHLSILIEPWLPANPMIVSLVQDGILGGVGAILVFLPQIVILFFFIALLEDSGYLVRASFLMDKLFSWTGLNGRSFIPLLSSFACAIPGIMATRAIPEERARLCTILIAPLMSCSARLPIYVLMISSFIAPQLGSFVATLCLFAMYMLGPILALPLVYFFNRSIFFKKSNMDLFLLEFPPYRRPRFFNVYYRTYSAGKKFIIKAGSIIFLLSLFIWFLAYFPITKQNNQDSAENAWQQRQEIQTKTLKNQAVTEIKTPLSSPSPSIENSYLGRVGTFLTPLFAPLGFDWKITVAVISSFPAREVILSTLGIIYNIDWETATTNIYSLRQQLRAERHENGEPVYTLALALSLMVFFALCSQCMSTLAIIHKELAAAKWAIFVFVYMTCLAWLFSFFTYQGVRALSS